MAIQDSGSNYQFFKRSLFSKAPRSVFDLSYLNTFTAKIGALIPFWTQHTVPNEDYTINVEALARCVNPPVVPLMSRLRIFFHVFWIDYQSLWKGWQVFITKGRDGNYVGKVPSIAVTEEAFNAGYFARGSLADYLGFNTSVPIDSVTTNIPTPFSALPFMMYQRIYRDYYMYQNLFQSGVARQNWFPYYDGDFRLTLSSDNINLSESQTPTHDDWHNLTDITDSYPIALGALRYRNWVEDYFTSAFPSPQRGTEAGLQLSGDLTLGDSLGLPVSFEGAAGHTLGQPVNPVITRMFQSADAPGMMSSIETKGSTVVPAASVSNIASLGGLYNNPNLVGAADAISDSVPYYMRALTNGVVVPASFNSPITLAALRELNAAQRIMEKMALTNGSYGDFCKTFFDETPRSARDHRPFYVGGCYQPIKITEVLQTGGTVVDSGTAKTVQGTQTGYATSYGSGFIGKFHCDDYGLFMGIMSIVPDAMYCQGLHRDAIRSVQEDFYIPERAGLSPQAILNQELFYQPGNDTVNNDLYAYINRFDEMRFRSNEVHGLVADPDNLSFFPYTQARYFTSLPTYSHSFMTMDGTVRNDWLSAPSEVPFCLQVANRVRAVRPLPYRAAPAELFKTV